MKNKSMFLLCQLRGEAAKNQDIGLFCFFNVKKNLCIKYLELQYCLKHLFLFAVSLWKLVLFNLDSVYLCNTFLSINFQCLLPVISEE